VREGETLEADETHATAWFAAVFEANYEQISRYVRRRVHNADVEDVVSEVFLIAWRRRADIDEDRVRLWLFGTSRRVVANYLRVRGRKEALQDQLEIEGISSAPDAGTSVADRAAVVDFLSQLPPRERAVLLLVEWDGLRPSEVAKVLGESPSAVRIRLHRARIRFSKLVRESEIATDSGKADGRSYR
jgi:RNA polymerase sigma factor (sigma-70 family)